MSLLCNGRCSFIFFCFVLTSPPLAHWADGRRMDPERNGAEKKKTIIMKEDKTQNPVVAADVYFSLRFFFYFLHAAHRTRPSPSSFVLLVDCFFPGGTVFTPRFNTPGGLISAAQRPCHTHTPVPVFEPGNPIRRQ